jgi:hypothetical protein
MQEPRDGDFVAYIETLQRESAARLAQQHIVVDLAFGTKGDTTAFQEKAASAGAPAAGQPAVFTRRDRDSKLVKAIVSGVVGVALLLAWLANGGVFPFIISVALLAYALPRLIRALRETPTTGNKAMVDLVFGRSGTRTPGKGK